MPAASFYSAVCRLQSIELRLQHQVDASTDLGAAVDMASHQADGLEVDGRRAVAPGHMPHACNLIWTQVCYKRSLPSVDALWDVTAGELLYLSRFVRQACLPLEVADEGGNFDAVRSVTDLSQPRSE